MGVILRQHQRRGRLGADDAISLADEIGQDADVAHCGIARRLHIAHGQRRHAATDLPGRDVHLDAVVLKNGDRGGADERVVVAGKDIDEVSNTRTHLVVTS